MSNNILKKYKRIEFIKGRLSELENELKNTSKLDRKIDIGSNLLSLQNTLIYWLSR